jgi:hypothetical protein
MPSIYDVESDIIYVAAVMHVNQKPDYWGVGCRIFSPKILFQKDTRRCAVKIEEPNKTESELQFEKYLVDSGIDYKPIIEGTSKRPDYRIFLGGSEIFFEVKEFNQPFDNQIKWIDPYSPIRSKIDDAHEQLHALKGRMCGIVLANYHSPVVVLQPKIIMGAMLGSITLTMPFNPVSGSCDDSLACYEFGKDGKMICHDNNGRAIAPDYTTISAVCILNKVAVGIRHFAIKIKKLEHDTGVMISLGKYWELLQEAERTDPEFSHEHLRIVVCENPCAVTHLTEDFGTGPYDERYSIRERCFSRVFVGSLLETLEAEEHAAGVE